MIKTPSHKCNIHDKDNLLITFIHMYIHDEDEYMMKTLVYIHDKDNLLITFTKVYIHDKDNLHTAVHT